jgi:hypothetical protein
LSFEGWKHFAKQRCREDVEVVEILEKLRFERKIVDVWTRSRARNQ